MEITSASRVRIGVSVDHRVVGVELDSLKIGPPWDLPSGVDLCGIVYMVVRVYDY